MGERTCVFTIAESKMQNKTHPENLSVLAVEPKTDSAAFGFCTFCFSDQLHAIMMFTLNLQGQIFDPPQFEKP